MGDHPKSILGMETSAHESPGHCPGSREATAEELLLGFGIFSFSPAPGQTLHPHMNSTQQLLLLLSHT